MKNEWKTKPLGDVLEVQNGYAFDSTAFTSSKGVPLIRIRDLKEARKPKRDSVANTTKSTS